MDAQTRGASNQVCEMRVSRDAWILGGMIGAVLGMERHPVAERISSTASAQECLMQGNMPTGYAGGAAGVKVSGFGGASNRRPDGGEQGQDRQETWFLAGLRGPLAGFCADCDELQNRSQLVGAEADVQIFSE